MSKKVNIPGGLTLYYVGVGPEAGPLPAFFYFSLSGEESLELPPYNHPVTTLAQEKMRIFSVTLPGHEEGRNKHHAIKYWADQIKVGHYPLEELLTQLNQSLEWLIQEGWVDPLHIATAGLSRGGLIATLFAAKNRHIKTCVGFAPVVDLAVLADFAEFKDQPRLLERISQLSLFSVIEQLTHLEHLRFYISIWDERVHTDRCYHFIRELSQKVQEKRARHCHVELFLTPPIGFMGHGTAPHIFEEGSALIKRQLFHNA